MTSIAQLLGDKADSLLNFKNPKISKERLHLPGPDVVDRLYAVSDRNNRVLGNLQRIVDHGRLGGTGYLSILPVDQGIEHSGGASFAKNPDYFDAENIVRLAIEGGCNAVASTYGVLGRRRPQIRAQDSVPGEDQPQRAADLPEQVRPDHVRHREAGGGHGRRGGRGHHLLRLGPERAADCRGGAGLRPRARDGPGDGAVVLPAQQRLQEGQGLTTSRPT